jgi:pimeloyl-ACP methyl ester carboxylesterase
MAFPTGGVGPTSAMRRPQQRLFVRSRSRAGMGSVSVSRGPAWAPLLSTIGISATAVASPGCSRAAPGSGRTCARHWPLPAGSTGLTRAALPRHALRLTVAALRDGIRGLRGAEPYRIPIVGAPGALAAINCPEAVSGMEAITRSNSKWRNECCPRGMLGRSYELEREARRISCPTLYCIAEDDEVNPPELGKRVAKRVPASELRLYPGGHFDSLQGETFERVVERPSPRHLVRDGWPDRLDRHQWPHLRCPCLRRPQLRPGQGARRRPRRAPLVW